MKTIICPTCGCSLVRLGVSKDKAAMYRYDGNEYYFCCQGCIDIFISDPKKYIQELNDFIVCPTCLAEKPLNMAAKLEITGQDVHFCRCPHCQAAFLKDPDFYIERLEGTIPNKSKYVFTSSVRFC